MTLAKECKDKVSQAYQASPPLPFLSDREEELFAPLFSLCSLLNPRRVDELRVSVQSLSESKRVDDQEESLSLKLLEDLRTVWTDGSESRLTKHILEDLTALTDSPWGQEFGLNARRLARMLRPFDIFPRDVRDKEARGKGYLRVQVMGACTRYLAQSKDASVTSATEGTNAG